MLDKILSESQLLKAGWVGPICLLLLILSWATLGLGLAHLQKVNLQSLTNTYITQATAEAPNHDAPKQNPPQPQFLQKNPVPQSLEEYTRRVKTAKKQVDKLQTQLKLPRNSKLEYILGLAVKKGLLHPIDATQLHTEYQTLAKFQPPKNQ